MTIRVLVVDDHDLIRAGLITILGSDPTMHVVGEAGDGPSAVRAARSLLPDVVLMDVQMPGGDGIAATQAISDTLPRVRVLLLTMFDLDDYVVRGLRAGASGYLTKVIEPAGLLQAVKCCAAGQSVLGGQVMEQVLRPRLGVPAEVVPGLDRLTCRELQVLRAMARGLSNAEIGTELFLAPTTVKTHVARVLAKLGVRDRVQAVVLAHRAGVLLEP